MVRPFRSPARRQALFVAGRSLRAAGGTAFGLALPWYALVSLGSVTAFGVISGVSMAFSVGGALVCVLLSRVDPRRLSIAALTGQAATLIAFGAWALVAAPSIAVATALVAVAALFAAVADPLGIVLIAAVGDASSESGHAPRGSLVSRALSVPAIVGMGASTVAGIAVSVLGPEPVLLAAALLLAGGTAFIAAAVGFERGPVAPAASPWARRGAIREVGGEVRASLGYIRSQRWLAVRFVAYPLFWPLAGVGGFLLPTIAVGLGLSAAVYGAAGSAMGIVQAAVASRLGRHLATVVPGLRSAIGVPALWIGSLVLVGLAPNAPLLLGAMLLSRLAGTYNEAVWTAVFAAVPGARRTMISSLDWLSSQVLAPATRLVAPAVVLAIGAGPALAAFAGVAALGFAACGLVGSRLATGDRDRDAAGRARARVSPGADALAG